MIKSIKDLDKKNDEFILMSQIEIQLEILKELKKLNKNVKSKL